jgi:molybdate transport system permease protein
MTDFASIALLSLKVAMTGVAVAAPIGFFLAFALARWRFPGRALLSAMVMLPLVMPPVVTGLVLLDLFGPRGPLGQFFAGFGIEFGFRWTGAALVAGLVALPLIVRPMRLALEAVDPGLHEALAVTGRSAWHRLVLLDLPLALPGILAGIILGFAKALGEFGATITFGASIPGETRTIPLAIFAALQTTGGGQLVLVLSAISIGISLIAVVASEAIVERLRPRLSGQWSAADA